MINDVNNLLLRERGAVTKAIPQQFYVCMYVELSCASFILVLLLYRLHFFEGAQHVRPFLVFNNQHLHLQKTQTERERSRA